MILFDTTHVFPCRRQFRSSTVSSPVCPIILMMVVLDHLPWLHVSFCAYASFGGYMFPFSLTA